MKITRLSQACVCAGLCLAVFLTACTPAKVSYTPVFVEHPCPVEVPSKYDVRCGTVSVPEDREIANGRQVKLSIAAAQPPGGTTEAPPVIMLTGGPDGAALEGLPFLLAIFDKVITQRPVIFFDQCGAGFSGPPFDGMNRFTTIGFAGNKKIKTATKNVNIRTSE